MVSFSHCPWPLDSDKKDTIPCQGAQLDEPLSSAGTEASDRPFHQPPRIKPRLQVLTYLNPSQCLLRGEDTAGTGGGWRAAGLKEQAVHTPQPRGAQSGKV